MENINVGAEPNDGTGLPLRDAFIKVNENFALIKQPDWDEVDTESLAYIKNKPDIPEPVNQIDLFLELNDTPNSYEGQAGKIPTVKQDETGLDFAAAPQSLIKHRADLLLYGIQIKFLHPDYNHYHLRDYLQLMLYDEITAIQWNEMLEEQVEKYIASGYVRKWLRKSNKIPVRIRNHNILRKTLGVSLWTLIEPEIHQLLNEKQWISELKPSNKKDFVLSVVSKIASEYRAPISIAVPIAGLILGSGIINLNSRPINERVK